MSASPDGSFLSSHAQALATAESTLRSLTWFLPWFRFREADLASESLTALLNLTSLYHDTVLARRLAKSQNKPVAAQFQSDHARFDALASQHCLHDP